MVFRKGTNKASGVKEKSNSVLSVSELGNQAGSKASCFFSVKGDRCGSSQLQSQFCETR